MDFTSIGDLTREVVNQIDLNSEIVKDIVSEIVRLKKDPRLHIPDPENMVRSLRGV